MQEILTYIEQAYHQTGILPSKEKIAEHFDLELRVLAGIFRRSEFKTAYQARGLPNYNQHLQSRANRVLTPMQLAVANQILNTYDRKTLSAKLKAMGVTTLQYQAWLKEQAFQDYLRSESQNRLGNSDIDARLSLMKLVQDGDFQSIKFFYEISGQHSPQERANLNLMNILSQLMEILVQYLAPNQLIEVADKMELVLNGSSVIPISPPVDVPLSAEENSGDIDAIQRAEQVDGPKWDADERSQSLHFTIR
jgi:hypothetical protein